VLTSIGVVIALIAFANPELAKPVGQWLQDPDAWRGISRWWGVLPIAGLVIWGLMKANYATYDTMQQERSRTASELSKLKDRLRPELDVLRAKPAACQDCTSLTFVRLGVWNASDATVKNARVFLESLTPGWPGGRRELRWVGMQRGYGESFRPHGTMAAHAHVELLVRQDLGRAWTFDVGGTLPGPAEQLAKIVIEADDMAPVFVEVQIDRQLLPGFPGAIEIKSVRRD
jgi:hypothetical protein